MQPVPEPGLRHASADGPQTRGLEREDARIVSTGVPNGAGMWETVLVVRRMVGGEG